MIPRTVLGAIDAGSNAIRMVVAALVPSPRGGFEQQRLEADRVAVRLGAGAFTRGALAPEAIDAAVAAFAQFRAAFDRHGVSAYRAVATSAVRSASNRDVLLHRLHHEANIDLDVIDGEEEARLVRKAVLGTLGEGAAPGCILDLGGGSLELNLRIGASWHGHSLPIGTVRLLETFGLGGAIGDAEAQMVRRFAATVARSVLPGGLGSDPATTALAAITGGNADALVRLWGDGAQVRPTLEVAALERALPELLGADIEQRMSRYGVRRDRAEVMGVAALVFATVARQLGVQRLVAPGVGIREALLQELAEAAGEQRTRAADKALLTAARTFAGRVQHDTTHGEQVRALSRTLFHQLRDLHQLPDELGIVLEVAALLHDVGEVVNTRGHHKHSEYMIRWAKLPGLEEPRREMVALLARCHRKAVGDVRKVLAEAPLAKEQRTQLRRLAALLRLADGLDFNHRQRVEALVACRTGTGLVLDLTTRDGPSRDDGQLLRKAELFEQEFGVTVQVTVGRSAPDRAGLAAPDRAGLAAPARPRPPTPPQVVARPLARDVN